ncbi:MAG: hypothetical protein RIR97_1085 [Pseudomonadota bacterium]
MNFVWLAWPLRQEKGKSQQNMRVGIPRLLHSHRSRLYSSNFQRTPSGVLIHDL